MLSSQIFSVCWLPEVGVHAGGARGDRRCYPVRGGSGGLDTFDPTTMQTDHRRGDDVPCWMPDTDDNELYFRVVQVFFPRTFAWESLRKALEADYDDAVWDHLAGAWSAPFEAGDERRWR